jgi:hypothetical protein
VTAMENWGTYLTFKKSLLTAVCIGAGVLSAAEFPRAEISNGLIQAKLLLPDAEKGYYRATRFDWSGQIQSLVFKGHDYFGEWNDRPYDPKLHDAIMGPVEEFSDTDAPGYAEAPVGGTFVKIGVGVLRKPQEKAYDHFKTYEIVDPGKWTVKADADSVEFTHVVKDPVSGYGYEYTKMVRLAKGKPELALEHRLKNTGTKAISTEAYEHNFYMLDKQPTGPDVVVKFPFEVKAVNEWKPGLVELRGKELAYVKELQKGDTAYNSLTGFGPDVKDYDIRVENSKTGAGVRQRADRPLSRMVYWSIRPTACPEAYIHVAAAPGKEFTWRIVYDFYLTK